MTISIINQVTVIAPALLSIVIKSFLINRTKHLKLKSNKLTGKKIKIYTCAYLCSMQLNQTSLNAGLLINRENRKHMVASTFFSRMPWLHIIVMIAGIHISQEIFAIDVLTAIKPLWSIRQKHVVRLLRLYED